MSTPLLLNSTQKSLEVEQLAAQALSARIASSADYTQQEIEKISALDKSLFPAGFQISEETQETFRVLCSFARCELRPSRAITSHRPFLGPVIVFLKRLSWPLIRFHLKETFESMQFFNSRLVASHAQEVCRLERLKRQMETDQRKTGDLPR